MTTAFDRFVEGQRVRARWTNSNQQYEADATVTRVNAKTVRVQIDGATILRTGLDWTTDGRLTVAKRSPMPGEGWNTAIPFPGTPGNRIDPIEEATAEEIELSKVLERTRLNRKIDRFEGFATNAQKSADAAFRASDAQVADIPLGQPILVGHHSERGHRRRIQRSWDLLGKGVAESKRADGWESRAAGIEREMRRKGL